VLEQPESGPPHFWQRRQDCVLVGHKRTCRALRCFPLRHARPRAQAAPGATGEVDPLVKFTEHGDVVEDVDWHRHHEHLFGSVGDDKHVYMYVPGSLAMPLPLPMTPPPPYLQLGHPYSRQGTAGCARPHSRGELHQL